MTDYTLFDVTVTLLTPLHIGSGHDLLHEYDYAIHNGRTWRINEDALLAVQDVDDPALVARLAATPPARLLRRDDFQVESRLFRYVIRGTPRSGAEGAQVREQLKDAYDRPYLSGTSLKGALRTALAWHAWEERKMRPERRKLKPDSRFAAQDYERDLLGKNPNHDLLRALQVGDSALLGADRLMLVNARVVHRGGRATAPIEMEAILPDTAFRLTCKLDEALFTEWARRRGLNLRGAEWLRRLPTIVQAHSAHRLAQEAKWFAEARGANRVAEFYRKLQHASLPQDGFLLQLGWGTGWDGKTFGSRLRADTSFMEGILRSRREGGYGIARGQRRPGDPFPRSRRVLVRLERAHDGQVLEEPVSPLGWALIEMKPRR